MDPRFDTLRELAADPTVQAAARLATQRGVPVHLVGGVVRDSLLGRQVQDVDLVLGAPDAGSVHALARELADGVDGSYVPLDEERGIARVVLPDGRYLDLTLRAGATLEEDLRRRDFTLNAMAFQPETGLLEDPTGGEADLRANRLRLAGPGSLVDDPLRCLRAVRFLCQVPGLRAEEGLEEALKEHAPLLDRVSPERVRDELFASFRVDLTPQIGLLQRTGLLLQVLPELEPAGRTEQNHYHHLNVLEHTLEVLRGLERFAAAGFAGLAADPEPLRSHLDQPLAGGRTAWQLLKLAALLHDVAKPETKSLDPQGRIRFFGHEEKGARRVEEIGRRLALSNREIKRLVRIVALHLQPVLLPFQDPSEAMLHRFFRQAGDAAPDLLVLSAADTGATRGPAQSSERLEVHRRFVAEMLEEYFQEGRLACPKVPITGADLIVAFGLQPGPEVGRLLEGVAEAVAEGAVGTREEALAWASEHVGRGRR